MKWIGMLHFNANYSTDYTIRIVLALSMDHKLNLVIAYEFSSKLTTLQMFCLLNLQMFVCEPNTNITNNDYYR